MAIINWYADPDTLLIIDGRVDEKGWFIGKTIGNKIDISIPPEEFSLVVEKSKCPKCGNRNVETLTIDEDECVTCECGHQYLL